MKSPHSHLLRAVTRNLTALTLTALAVASTACSDDTTSPGQEPPDEDETTEPVEESDAGGGDAGAQERDPLYLIATSFVTGDERETYLVTSSSFDSSTKVPSLTDGPKLLGGIVPVVHDGVVFVPDSNSPVLLRFEVDANDKLVKVGEPLSFAGVGMTTVASWHVYVVNDEKAYVFDPAGPRIVVWNPSTMKLTGKQIELDEIERDGFSANLAMEPSAGPKQRGSELILPLGWADQDGNARHASGLLVLDTERDEVVAVDEDERCGESYILIEAPDGAVYFFPPDWSALPHYFTDGFDNCVLRMNDGETSFDEDYVMNLSELGTGSAAASAVPDGEGGFYFLALDEELWDDGNNMDGLFWRVWHYDFESEESAEVEDAPLWGHNLYYVTVDGKAIMPRSTYDDEGSHTNVYAAGSDGKLDGLFSFDADWYGVATLR